MANTVLTGLTNLTTPASGDKLYIIDVSDTTDATSGSSKQITYTNFVGGILTELAITSTVAELNILDGATLTVTELNYVDGVTSAIQTQMNLKAPLASPTFTGTVTIPKTTEIQDTTGDHQYVLAVSELTADRTITLPLLIGNDDFVFEDHTQTMTNKRITKRITSITSSATPTVNTDNCDAVTITALAAAITSMTSGLSGTPTNFQTLVYRILDDGTNRAITWGASFEARGVALPTTTTANKLLTVGFIYDTVDSIWGCVASVVEV